MRRFTPLLLVLVLACGGVKKQLKTGNQYLADERWPAAVREYQAVLEIEPKNPEALIGIARAWRGSGEPDRAVSYARRALSENVPGAREILVDAMVQAGKGRDAVELAQEGLELEPDNPAYAALLAEARLAASDFIGAREAVDVALNETGAPEVVALASWIYSRNGDNEKAVGLAEQVAGSASENADVFAEAAAVFLQAGEPEKAHNAASRGRAAFMDHPDYYLVEASRLSTGGDSEGAVRRLSWARAMFPDDGRYARELGMLYVSLGELERGSKQLVDALNLPPYKNPEVIGGVSVDRTDKGGLKPSERKALRVEMLDIVGKAMEQLGDKRSAATVMQRAVEEDAGGDDDDWLRVARAWEEAGDWEMFGKAVSVALDRNPKNFRAQYDMARAYAKFDDVNRAIGHARLSWDLAEGAPEVAILLGALYEKRGENFAARQVYEEALLLPQNAGDPQLKRALARVQ